MSRNFRVLSNGTEVLGQFNTAKDAADYIKENLSGREADIATVQSFDGQFWNTTKKQSQAKAQNKPSFPKP